MPKKTVKKAAKKAPKAVAKSVKITAVTTTIPTYDDVSYAAYLNFMSRVENGIFGDETGDWLAAEHSFKAA